MRPNTEMQHKMLARFKATDVRLYSVPEGQCAFRFPLTHELTWIRRHSSPWRPHSSTRAYGPLLPTTEATDDPRWQERLNLKWLRTWTNPFSRPEFKDHSFFDDLWAVLYQGTVDWNLSILEGIHGRISRVCETFRSKRMVYLFFFFFFFHGWWSITIVLERVVQSQLQCFQ